MSSNLLVSALCLNVCGSCVPNVMNLSICFIKKCTSSKLARLLDTASKFVLFLVSALKGEKLIKKTKPTRKLKHANSILESFEYFCQMSQKLIRIILSYIISKLARFFETQCTWHHARLRQIVWSIFFFSLFVCCIQICWCISCVSFGQLLFPVVFWVSVKWCASLLFCLHL